MKNVFNNFLKNDKGSVWMIVGVSIITLMIFIGVAIDMGRYFLVRNKLLSALDAGLIAAADIATRQLVDDPTGAGKEQIIERGRRFFRANFPVNYLGTQVDDTDILIDVNNDGVVTGEIVGAEMPLVFAGIFGLEIGSAGANIDIDVFSEVAREVGAPLEIALVLDYTPSMCFAYGTGSMWNRPRVVDQPACPKFNTMKTQAINFINQIQASVDNAEANGVAAFYSFIPFTHTVRINGSTNNLNFCTPSQRDILPSAVGLSGNVNAVINSIQNSSVPSESGSNMAVGMWWGWNSLRNNPASQNLFIGSSAKTAPANHPETIEAVNNFDVSKILILLTDGENEYPNYRCDSNPPRRLSGDPQGFTRDLAADTQFLDLCQRAKAEGIQVYTIAFDVPDSPTVTTRGLLTSCANPNNSYNAGDSEELAEVFSQIANDVIDLRITK
jgi:Flp pilus assembly protein TadG